MLINCQLLTHLNKYTSNHLTCKTRPNYNKSAERKTIINNLLLTTQAPKCPNNHNQLLPINNPKRSWFSILLRA